MFISQLRNRYTPLHDLKWSAAEKVIARKAFDRALKQELDAVIQETKSKAAKVQQPADVWKLERYLTERRNQIDCEYDYRYSVLPFVFGALIRKGRLSEEDVQGLREDKMHYIRKFAA